MNTFSQIVDELVAEHKRPDLRLSIAAYLNQTIREMHSGPNGETYLFHDNLVEEVLVATGVSDAGVYVAPIVESARLQRIESVYYPTVGRYAKPVSPGTALLDSDSDVSRRWSYYRTGPNIAFRGFGSEGSEIWVASYVYPRSLAYIEKAGDRWASWNEAELAYDFRAGTGKTQEELLDLSTNWIIDKWETVVKEGVRAKVFKRLGDEIRQRTSYSMYETQRLGMALQEAVDGGAHFSK